MVSQKIAELITLDYSKNNFFSFFFRLKTLVIGSSDQNLANSLLALETTILPFAFTDCKSLGNMHPELESGNKMIQRYKLNVSHQRTPPIHHWPSETGKRPPRHFRWLSDLTADPSTPHSKTSQLIANGRTLVIGRLVQPLVIREVNPAPELLLKLPVMEAADVKAPHLSPVIAIRNVVRLEVRRRLQEVRPQLRGRHL